MKQSLFEQNYFLPISYGQMMIQKRPSNLTESDSERETARWLKQQIAICSIKPLWKSKKILAHNVSFQIVTRPCKRLFLFSDHIYNMERKSSSQSGAFFTFTWQLKKPECPSSAEGRKWRFWMWNLNHQIIANLLKNANEIVIFKKKTYGNWIFFGKVKVRKFAVECVSSYYNLEKSFF